ncbi:MAG TPA: DAK2 domain-containing protein [Actinomycetota bacterium]|nr:DAK2 domain-containing protein [Actinomycetota bacterium]
MEDRLDAATLRRAMQIYAESLRDHRAELDSLNVYPVPDGDTGTNLVMTQEAVLSALPRHGDEDDMRALGAAIARGSLMGARGNSGVILSQILRGICEKPPSGDAFSPTELASAFQRAAEEAHRAVAKPVEGTVLTVIRDAARAALNAAGQNGCLVVVEAALKEARASLVRTEKLLPQLSRAGVVDAGAKGIVLLLDAMRAALSGESLSEPIGPLGPVGQASEARQVGRLEFAFEVQYLLEAPDEAMPSLRQGLATLGDSLVVVGGNGLFNVHVHTNEPGSAVELGVEAGRPRDVQIVDLEDQVVDCIGGQARAVRVAEQVCALVAVAEGNGLARIFASLGALVVGGGPGNNPSVGDLIKAIESAPAGAVMVLPNHENVAPATQKAAVEVTKDVRVVQSLSIPSGLAAATVFSPLAQVDENARAMEEAAEACRWGELVRAERDAQTPAGSVQRGDWIGTNRGQVVSVNKSLSACTGDVGRCLAGDDAEVVTLIVGADATPKERDTVRAALEEALPGLELQVLEGGQPRYPFLIGVE